MRLREAKKGPAVGFLAAAVGHASGSVAVATRGSKRERERDWVDFAGVAMILIGALDFFQGLIAIVRGQYYSFDPNEIIVVDLTAWGWIILFWGSLVAISGLALWSRSNLARWLAVGIMIANAIAELGFAGGNHYPHLGTHRARAQHPRPLRAHRALERLKTIRLNQTAGTRRPPVRLRKSPGRNALASKRRKESDEEADCAAHYAARGKKGCRASRGSLPIIRALTHGLETL